MTKYRMHAEHKIIAEDFTHFAPGTAFQECFTKKYTPAYMPELMRFKIAASAESNLWKKWYTTGSLIITGITKKNNPVVAFVHKENSLNNERRIKNTIAFGTLNGAGILPNYEFYKILEQQDDQQIFVIDYKTLYNNPQHEINIKDALSHPFVIPFCGGEKNAQQYLQKYHEVTTQNTIQIIYGDDPHLQPLARLLYLTPTGSFDGSASLESSNCLLGIKEDTLFTTRNTSPQNPSLESLLQLAKKYISPVNLNQYEEELRIIYDPPNNQDNQPNQLPYFANLSPPITHNFPHTFPHTPPPTSSQLTLNSHPPVLSSQPTANIVPLRALSTLHRLEQTKELSPLLQLVNTTKK